MVLKKESKNKSKSTKDSKKATSPQKEKIVSLKDLLNKPIQEVIFNLKSAK